MLGATGAVVIPVGQAADRSLQRSRNVSTPARPVRAERFGGAGLGTRYTLTFPSDSQSRFRVFVRSASFFPRPPCGKRYVWVPFCRSRVRVIFLFPLCDRDMCCDRPS